MQIKLLVLDIDGTIAGKTNSVSTTVREAIQAAAAKGVHVALATGRMYQSAWRFHTQIGSKLPILAYNGAWIQNSITGERHQHLPVPSDLALPLLDILEEPDWRSHIGIHFYIDDRLYVRQITAATEVYAARSGIEPILVGDLRQLLDFETTKILVISQDTQVISRLLRNLQQRYPQEKLFLTQSTPTFLEITHSNANKGSATRYLAEEILGLTSENVMAIGDNFNDETMLQYAGLSIAMGNAPAEVQQLAQWVAPNVEVDGVAVAIEKFLL